MMTRFKPIAALLFTVIVWGITPVFLRSLSVGLGPADALVIRYVPIALVCIFILAWTGGWRIARADWPRLLVISLIGIFTYSAASVFGFASVPAGIGGLLYAIQPLFIAFLAALLLGERLTIHILLGSLLALAGTVLLLWNDFAAGPEAQSYAIGLLLLVLACAAWAFYSVPGKVLFQRYGTLSMTAMSLLIGTLPMLAFATPGTLDTLRAMTMRHWLELAYLGGFSTFIAMFTWTYGTARVSAATSGAFLYLIPVIAVFAGALLLEEAVTLATVLGGLLILAGVAFAQFGQRARKVRHEQNAV